MQIDIVSILLILGLGQCLFLSIALLAGPQRRQLANQLLAVLLFTFLWYQLEFFLLRHKLDTNIPFIYSTRYGAWLVVGPLILLYNRATLIQDYQLKWSDALHFLIFFLLTLLGPLSFGEVITDRSVDYGMLTVFDKWNREPITFRQYVYGVVFILQFVHALVYILIAFQESKKWTDQAKDMRSSIPVERVRTLQFLYLAAASIIVLCSAFVVYQFATTMWRRNFDYFYVLPTLLFVFGLAYRAMRYPNSVFLLEMKEAQAKYTRSNLPKGLKTKLLRQLQEQLEIEKIYRNNELRLGDLASVLNTSTHHLSQLINEELQQNFFELINSYRIEEAKVLIKKEPDRSLLDIAFEAGFNNKNSFNSAFKKMEGMTPSAFRKSL